MSFDLRNFKEKVITTVPYETGKRYEAIVTDVAVVKTDYLRITFKVEGHENVNMFGTLYPTVSREGKRKPSLLETVKRQLSTVFDKPTDVVAYLGDLEASSHTENPKTIGIYVLPVDDKLKVYLSKASYDAAVVYFNQQNTDEEDDI